MKQKHLAMTKSNLTIFILLPLLCFFIFCKRSNSLKDTQYTREISSLELDTIHKHLGKMNKPPVLTIESSDGDIIDCIHLRKQPALDHPLLKRHKIQSAPSEMPKAINFTEGVWQIWHQKGQHCPNGTIPIRRTTVNDVLRAKSLNEFGKKPSNNREYAIALTPTLPNIYGAKAIINVWNPSVEAPGEFSLSQIWVAGGDGPETNTIESGWQVYPEKYNDTRPRLFVYWTSDAYQSTGCYNLDCPGFVQTSQHLVVGGALSPVSSIGGRIYEINFEIWKDPTTGNWWLIINNSIFVGYWPKELFTHIRDQASLVHWGGEIVNYRRRNRHTATQMGSGLFPQDGYGKASFFRNLYVVGSNNTLYQPFNLSTRADNQYCYNIEMGYDESYGTHFYYGGPGRNPSCP